jgi:hypothetical protein
MKPRRVEYPEFETHEGPTYTHEQLLVMGDQLVKLGEHVMGEAVDVDTSTFVWSDGVDTEMPMNHVIPPVSAAPSLRDQARDMVRHTFETSGLDGKIHMMDRLTFTSVLYVLPEKLKGPQPQEAETEALVLSVQLVREDRMHGGAELEESGALVFEGQILPMTVENAQKVASELVQWARARRSAQAVAQ